MLAAITPECCHVWLMTSRSDTHESLMTELEGSRLGHNLQCLAGPEALKSRLGQLDGAWELAGPNMLLLSLEDSDDLCHLMGSLREDPGFRALPVIVLVGEDHSLDLRRAYGSGITSVVRLPRERADLQQVLEVLADYWLAVLPLERSQF